MTEETATAAPKRFRSPPYPAISLRAAVERAGQLYSKAQHYTVGWPVLADAWEYKVGSGSLGATAAALIQFGLLTDDGSGDKRKFTLSDAAIRIIRDADPASEKRKQAIARAALLPKIYAELWEKFGDAANVSTVVLQNYLTLDRKDEGKAPYGDDAVGIVISEYKETVTFAALVKSGTIAPDLVDKEPPKADQPPEQPPLKPIEPSIKVGDYVQWISGGAEQFQAPKRVIWVSEDGQFARVLGSHTGLPLTELAITDAPKTQAAPQAAATDNPIEVFLAADGRLQVSADVDAVGLQKLRDLLAKYDEILALMGKKN